MKYSDYNRKLLEAKRRMRNDERKKTHNDETNTLPNDCGRGKKPREIPQQIDIYVLCIYYYFKDVVVY